MKIKEIFGEINSLKNSLVSLVIKIISTDYMIIKQNNLNSESDDRDRIIQITVGDETGFLSVLVLNKNIEKIKIGEEIILRNVKIRILKNYLYLICDDDSKIFKSNGLIMNLNSSNLNFSRQTLNYFNYDI